MEVFQRLNYIYIVMELCTGGELFDKLYAQPVQSGEKAPRFTEADAKYLVQKMLQSLSYLVRPMVHALPAQYCIIFFSGWYSVALLALCIRYDVVCKFTQPKRFIWVYAFAPFAAKLEGLKISRKWK